MDYRYCAPILFLALLLLVQGCQTQADFENYVATFKGRPIEAWTAERSAPTFAGYGPTGDKLYTFMFANSPWGSRQMSRSCKITFVVEKELIKDFSLEGNSCVFADPPPHPGGTVSRY